jgi:hypothetical protein
MSRKLYRTGVFVVGVARNILQVNLGFIAQHVPRNDSNGFEIHSSVCSHDFTQNPQP